MKELSIYIHIPFCIKKCLYCDFLSFPIGKVGKSIENAGAGDGTVWGDKPGPKDRMRSYVNLICDEITTSAPPYQEYRVISIFWGGGTPSLLPAEEVRRIMDAVRENYRVVKDAEITMELNPETADGGKMRQYITAGINRLSIGLQSADDRELARIGRIHDYRTFLAAYDLARAAGFRNINVDLMAALPGQDAASYERTLKRTATLGPEHISAYSLILEEGTPLYEQQAAYRFPTEDEDREMYLLTRELLAAEGYHRYEISNYAREGYECRHNKVYWQRGNYVGFGLGASSMVQNARWSNPRDMEDYRAYTERLREGAAAVGHEAAGDAAAGLACSDTPDAESDRGEPDTSSMPQKQFLTLPEQMEEYMFLGLRMVRGVSAAQFGRMFGSPMEAVYGEAIDRLCSQGLLVREADRVRLTDRGLDVSNYAMAQFLFD